VDTILKGVVDLCECVEVCFENWCSLGPLLELYGLGLFSVQKHGCGFLGADGSGNKREMELICIGARIR
jgi:hypothetical protein